MRNVTGHRFAWVGLVNSRGQRNGVLCLAQFLPNRLYLGMDDPYQLVAPASAQAFLRSYDAALRRKGETLVRNGAVTEIEVLKPGRTFVAHVQDGGEYEVRVSYEQGDGEELKWLGDCTCSVEFNCEHAFAVVQELLARHSTALVRGLSATVASSPAVTKRPGRPKAAAKKPKTLAALLGEATGKPLNRDEALFLKRVQTVYTRAQQSRHITYWDFQEMGIPLKGGYGWDGLKIWPSVPQTEHEFWLYVANAVQERGGHIPAFMEPITQLALIQEELAAWKRKSEIEKWRGALRSLELQSASIEPTTLGETDLRLVIDPEECRMELRRPGQPDFEPLKQGHVRYLSAGWENGTVRFTAAGEWLWHAFEETFRYTLTMHWQRLDPENLRFLSHLLRFGALEGAIVTKTGQPLPRPAEPLRWDLIPATSAEEDYRLRLVQADGSPVPPVLALLPGSPLLYLTAQALFVGPACPPFVGDPAKETRIPAPAFECAAGVSLLQSVGVELPPRLRERVRTLPYQIAIQCDLRPTWPGSSSEECAVRVTAEAADGRRLVWTGGEWMDETPKARRRAAADSEMIEFYDSAVLAQARAVLEPLQLKPGSIGGSLAVRVTRKFPELFSNWLKTVPPQFTVHLGGDLASFAAANISGRVKLDVTETDIDWFDLRVVLDVSDATLSKEEIQLLLKAKGNYVRLPGKGWRRLQFDLSDEENERLAKLGLSARELSDEPQRMHALQLADDAAKSFLPEGQVENLQRRAAEIKTRVAPALPAGVIADLRPYQIEGFHFLAYLSSNRFGGILADDMGLGKTLQTLAWLMWLREQAPMQPASDSKQTPDASPGAAPFLVVCPKSVMDNWRAESTRFTPSLRVKVWPASELDTFQSNLASADLHVLNYNQFRALGEALIPVRWRAIILDEGQYIKNPSSQTALIARALRADHRLVLSGTPIENRLLDLWSLMAFVMPGVLSSRNQFAKLYDAKGDPFARRRLAARVRPFLLRRTKGQVAKDLPDRIEEDLSCEMEGEQKALYRAELKRAQQLLLGIRTQKELAQQQFHFLVSLLRLRQICCDPRLHHPETTASSAKTEALLEHLEPLMEEGQKVLVFSQFVELLNLLRPMLEERKWPVFYLAGETENRGELVSKFQAAEGPAVFLISLKAGGFGLNLTAASYVVLFDPWWNPAVENQAIDRTHRIGQVNKVIAYRLLIKDSIEEKIRALQKKKSALADDVLGEERFAQSLTIDDLRFLFAD